MTEFNKYSLYSLTKTETGMLDEVDNIISKIDNMKDYETVYNFISTNLGNIEEIVRFEFPKTNKSIGVVLKDNAIECFGLIGDTNFYKKGWRKTDKI